MTTKIYNQIRSLEKSPHAKDRIVTSRYMEGSYVAYLKNVYHIDAPQPLFEFVHPNPAPIIDNSRSASLTFKASLDCVMHGFTGYFDAVLYKDITISIHLLLAHARAWLVVLDVLPDDGTGADSPWGRNSGELLALRRVAQGLVRVEHDGTAAEPHSQRAGTRDADLERGQRWDDGETDEDVLRVTFRMVDP
ncbi:hypothetical protein quinque_005531 [Culex quinquefasciatus]